MDFDERPRDPYFDRYEWYGDRERPSRRGLYVFLAVFWFMAGIGLMAAAGYIYWDSHQTSEQWVYVRPTFDNNIEVAVAAAAQGPSGPSALGGQSFRVVIDKIGVDAPVAPYGLDDEQVPEVPYEPDLLAWYTFTAYPGTGENAVIAGHVTWNGPAAFARLSELQIGDGIDIVGENGARLIYRVADSQLIDPNLEDARKWLDPAGTGDVLTVITCGGEHFEDPGPLGGGYTHRQILRAELVGSQPAG